MTLDENDYLTFQLYTASKTPRMKNARIKAWIFLTVAFGCFSYLFYRSNNDALGIYFLILAGLTATLYPFYSRWRYKKYYLKYIRDTYKNRFGEECDLQFDTDTIIAKDKGGEVKINKSEIEEINEINDFYFIKNRSGTCLIISKSKTEDIEKIQKEIKSMISNHNIRHNIELDWKWR